MKVGIVVGSVREGRLGGQIGQWIKDQAEQRDPLIEGIEYELLDLKEFDVPLLTSPVIPGAAKKQYEDANVQAWSDAVDACDAFVFVTPEYNHGVPGPMKNAFDSLGGEWAGGKVVAFVGYGSAGAIRAVEQWRQIVSNFQMFTVRNEVNLSIFEDFANGELAPGERRPGELATVLADFEALLQRVS